LPEAKRGLVAAAGGVVRLPQRIPRNIALELILTGDFLDADRAAALGLVNRLSEPGKALDGAREMAAEIAANAPIALRVAKRIALDSQGLPDEEAWERQQEGLAEVRDSEDAAEGAKAFVEKRAPQWRNR
jgi:enoyl-CoA hydratase